MSVIVIAYITADNINELRNPQATLLDGMVEAQNDLGQITWETLTQNVAMGFAPKTAARVAVFNLDGADGLDVLHVTSWALGHSDARPELRY